MLADVHIVTGLVRIKAWALAALVNKVWIPRLREPIEQTREQ